MRDTLRLIVGVIKNQRLHNTDDICYSTQGLSQPQLMISDVNILSKENF